MNVNKRDFSQLNWLASDQCIWSRYCDAYFNSVWARLRCCLSNGRLKRNFLGIYLTRFSESIRAEIQKLWGSSFFSKYSKFNIDFKIAQKNLEKMSCFWGNCVWIGMVKLFLLRTGYFSSSTNVLASSRKVLHVNKRDFLQLNWLGSDQWIW